MKINNLLFLKIGTLITFILALSGCQILAKKQVMRGDREFYIKMMNASNEKSLNALAKFYNFKPLKEANAILTSETRFKYKLNSEVLPLFMNTPSAWHYAGFAYPYYVVKSANKTFDCNANFTLPQEYPVVHFFRGSKVIDEPRDFSKLHLYSSHTEDTFLLKASIPDDDKNINRREFDIVLSKNDIKKINKSVINFYKSLDQLCAGEIPQKIKDRLVLKQNNALTHYGFSEEDIEKFNIEEGKYVYILKENIVGRNLKVFSYYVDIDAQATAEETWHMHPGGEIDALDYLVILYTQYASEHGILKTTELVTNNLASKDLIDQKLLQFRRAGGNQIKLKDLLPEYTKGSFQLLTKLPYKELPVKFYKNGKTYLLTIPGKDTINLYRKGDYLTLSDDFKISQQQSKLSIDFLSDTHSIISNSFKRNRSIKVDFNLFDKHSKIGLDNLKALDSYCSARGELGEAEINNVVKHSNKTIQEIARKYFKENKSYYSSYNLKITCEVAAKDHYPYFGTISYKMPRTSSGVVNIKFHLPSIFLAKKEDPVFYIDSY